MNSYFPYRINQAPTNTDYSLNLESVSMSFQFGFEGIKTGIVPLLRTFGKQLYYSKFTEQAFVDSYSHATRTIVKKLCGVDSLSYSDINIVAFHLLMLRKAQTESWFWPALITRDPSGTLDQETGHSRAFATMLTKPDPWNHYPVLMLEDFGKQPSGLQEPVPIENDAMLHQMFHVDPEVSRGFKKTIYFQIVNRNNRPYLRLNYLGNGSWHDTTPQAAQDLFVQYRNWHQKNARPKITVFTNWPGRVANTGNFWDMEISQQSTDLINDAQKRPGILETEVKSFHNRLLTQPQSDQYFLWIVNASAIDLGHLLPWMSVSKNVLIQQNMNWILYRAAPHWNSEVVSAY